ncbi:hypothetical protein Halru_2872 [Halovivax ruber XH-70]|uniref:DUF4129 domain-containing protein n=1 Tax=Halovivax ruber (strain DSM 18193 / JCM 13892 / XH-70) TaxID=797302 RepID=L0IHI9_HALRX|nr:hypothetical protein [Halovivax ruber]AGB17442.1 hypothetical protein Halru_2872 [Halovivax ruber XH-70]
MPSLPAIGRLSIPLRFWATVAVVVVVVGTALVPAAVAGDGAVPDARSDPGVAATADQEAVPNADQKAAPSVDPGDVAGVDPDVSPAVDSTNRTDRHRNPDSYDAEGDTAGLADMFEADLAARLETGANWLREGEYDLANESIGEDFLTQYAAYVDVADELDRNGTAELFEQTRTEQAALTSLLEDYEETKAAYDEAMADGATDLARERARELEAIATEINASRETLSTQYDDLEAAGAGNFSETTEAVESTAEEIRSTHTEITREAFEATALSVRARNSDISFTEPLRAGGRLVSETGSPVADEAIGLEVGNRSLRTTTDSRGRFSFSYRPVSIPASAENVTITYVPDPSSRYLGSRTTVPVSVTQESATIDGLTSNVSSIAFADPTSVSADVSVDGDPVDGLPLNVTLGGTDVGAGETENGSLDTPVSVPAAIPPGEHALGVTVPTDDPAVTATASTNVTVESTAPSLSIETERRADDLEINGSLAVDTVGVAGQEVTVAVDGERVTTATTAADGSFGTTVAAPSTVGEHQVTVSMDGAGTNLESVEATRTVEIPAEQASQGSSGVGIVAIGGAIVLLVLAGASWWRWRRSRGDSASRHRESTSDPSITARAVSGQLLSQAVDALEARRPDDAVRTAYVAVRSQLDAGLETPTGLTHWEFFRAYETPDETETDRLASLTAAYERATFDPSSVEPAVARESLAHADELCDGDATGVADGDAAGVSAAPTDASAGSGSDERIDDE